MKLKITRKIISVISFILVCSLLTGTLITGENAQTISSALGAQTFVVINDESGDTDSEYYKSDYATLEDMINAGRAKAAQVMEEGAVLLKNNGALPLAKGSKISLVGVTSSDPVYGGTGSGSIDVSEAVGIVDSLEAAGFELNPTLQASYTSEAWAVYKRSVVGNFNNAVITINEAPWDVVSKAAEDSFALYGDAAILTIGRVGGEGLDLIRMDCDGIDIGDGLGPDYLGMNANELSVLEGLKALKAQGKIQKIIVLVNYAGMVEAAPLLDDSVDAVMWVGSIGMGGAAIGRLLCGDASPSGRLPDTMWVDNNRNPVNANYGAWIYDDCEQYDVPCPIDDNFTEATLSSYDVYQEGMYLGYRYTETRYEDLVLGTPKVGDFSYSDVVAFPFGHGLSYADFSLSETSVTKTGDREYTVKVTVTNNSDRYSGKYSVPVYISKPYGDYAKQNGIQVPSVELINFSKTSLLAPGASEELTITLDEKYFTSYDSTKAKTYILMDGDYYVIVGGNAHEAVNNLLAAKAENGIQVDTSKIVGTEGDASRVVKFRLSYQDQKYAFSDAVSSLDGVTHAQITNLFDFTDINLYDTTGTNHVEYYSRENWAAVSLDMADGHVKLSMTEPMARDIFKQLPEMTGKYNNAPLVPEQYRQPIPTDDGTYPTYGKSAGLNLIDMMYDDDGEPISFFDPVWDTFMDQLSWEDTKLLISNGNHLTEGIDSVAKPETNDENGPNGFGGYAFNSNGYYSNSSGLTWRTEEALGHIAQKGKKMKPTEDADPNGYRKMTGFPANGILAATMNTKLATEVGEIIGNDGIWAGCSGLYGIGLNLHRSPYLGRTCEYFSECGMLTGLIGAAECLGIESKGVHVYNKHCALNDQENCRHGVACWIQEQPLREMYLRAFELPITMGGAFNTMQSFSRFGVVASAACPELCTSFLKGECGMQGIVLTDAYGDMDGSQNCDPYYEQVYALYVGGADLPDGTAPKTQNHFGKYETGYSKMAWAMRDAAKRVMYQTLWSNAMNGISSNTHIISITPDWQKTLFAADIAACSVFGLAMLWTLTALILEKKKKSV